MVLHKIFKLNRVFDVKVKMVQNGKIFSTLGS